MSLLKKIVMAGLALVLALEAGAQTPVLSLEEAMGIALRNNYDIRLSRNDSSLAALDYAYSLYAFAPRLSAAGGVLYNNNSQRQTFQDNTERSSNGIRSRNLTGAVNLDWTLFDGGRMFIARHRLREVLRLSELEIKNQIINSLSAVMRNYFAIVAQEQQLRALQDAVAAVAAEQQLPEGVLASRRLLEGLQDGSGWTGPLAGWRRALLEPRLAGLLCTGQLAARGGIRIIALPSWGHSSAGRARRSQ